MDPVLILLTGQALLGAYDNIANHELREALPARPSARRELRLHAVRGIAYAPVFLIFGWVVLRGWYAALFAAVLLAEILITLMDFVEEDRTRKLSANERITHTLLAINYGVLLGLVLPELWRATALPVGAQLVHYGPWSWIMSLAALGATAWGVRDWFAARRWEVVIETLKVPQADNASNPVTGRTVLITGGTGLIGRALCRRLLVRGDRPIVLTRDRGKVHALFGAKVQAVESLQEIDPRQPVDAVINLAGESIAAWPWTPARKAVLVESRIGTTRLLVEWLGRREQPPEVWINGSAVGWYGTHADELFTEHSLAGADFPALLCRAWEREARAAEVLGVRVVILRLGLVMGDGGLLGRLLPTFRLGLGSAFGNGRQWMPWIHMEDVLGVIEAALQERKFAGAYNVVAPESVSNATWVKTLASVLGRPAWRGVPARPLRAVMGEMAMLLLDGQRVFPVRLMSEGYQFRFPQLDAALRNLLRPPASNLETRGDAATKLVHSNKPQ